MFEMNSGQFYHKCKLHSFDMEDGQFLEMEVSSCFRWMLDS